MSTLKITSKETTLESFDVTPVGRLDSATYKQMESFLDDLIRPTLTSIRFDMAGLDYLSSMGLRVFMKCAKTLKANNAKMAMINLQPQIKKVFDIANAIGSMSVFETTEEADRYLDVMQKLASEKK